MVGGAGSLVVDNSIFPEGDDDPHYGGFRDGGAKVKQLHTGNLHLFSIDEAGQWRKVRSSVRLEPSTWEMLFEIARRERLAINELAQLVQIRLDPRLADFAEGAVDPTGHPAIETGAVRPVNVSSGLRAFAACYFWRMSRRLEQGDDDAPEREARLSEALRYVSPAYLDGARVEVRSQRSAQIRRGRPPRPRDAGQD